MGSDFRLKLMVDLDQYYQAYGGLRILKQRVEELPERTKEVIEPNISFLVIRSYYAAKMTYATELDETLSDHLMSHHRLLPTITAEYGPIFMDLTGATIPLVFAAVKHLYSAYTFMGNPDELPGVLPPRNELDAFIRESFLT